MEQQTNPEPVEETRSSDVLPGFDDRGVVGAVADMASEVRKAVKDVNNKTAENRELIDKLSENLLSKQKEEREERRRQIESSSIGMPFPKRAARAMFGVGDGGKNVSPQERREAQARFFSTPCDHELIKRLHKVNDDLLMLDAMYGASHPQNQGSSREYLARGGVRSLNLYREYTDLVNQVRAVVLDTTEQSEIVPTNFSSDFIDIFRLNQVVAADHRRVMMTSKVYEYPAATTKIAATLASEQTAMPADLYTLTPSSGDFGNVTFTAQKFQAIWAASGEVIEDAALELVQWGRTELARAIVDAEENALLNGDTANTHQDSDSTSTDPDQAWLGYRAKAIDDSNTVDGGNNACSVDDLNEAVKLMTGKFSVNRSRVKVVVGPGVLADLLVDNDVRTVDKYGPQATIITGELARVLGMPVQASEYSREDLNASGVYDGTTTDRACAHLVAWDRGWFGDRRMLTVESFRDPFHDLSFLVVMQREDFQWIDGTDQPAALVYNVTT